MGKGKYFPRRIKHIPYTPGFTHHAISASVRTKGTAQKRGPELAAVLAGLSSAEKRQSSEMTGPYGFLRISNITHLSGWTLPVLCSLPSGGVAVITFMLRRRTGIFRFFAPLGSFDLHLGFVPRGSPSRLLTNAPYWDRKLGRTSAYSRCRLFPASRPSHTARADATVSRGPAKRRVRDLSAPRRLRLQK